MTDRNSQARPLTALQRAILEAVWARGPVTADEVREALAPAHRLKDSSVRTLLRRLEARGLVGHRVDGKVFLYEARSAPRAVAARGVQQLIRQFWAGSVEQFVAGIVEEKIVSAEELERLAKKVRQTRRRK